MSRGRQSTIHDDLWLLGETRRSEDHCTTNPESIGQIATEISRFKKSWYKSQTKKRCAIFPDFTIVNEICIKYVIFNSNCSIECKTLVLVCFTLQELETEFSMLS